MGTGLEDLRVLKAAEDIADAVWERVSGWDDFARDVVGRQLARATDSIGANIAESYGRFNYGEKLQFLYYARGSLFEVKYWLNRARVRGLLPTADAENYATRLSEVGRQINAFASSLKSQRAGNNPKTMREPGSYYAAGPDDLPEVLFEAGDLVFLQSGSPS